MKEPLSPQEKKLLSYEKDCRNTYGERGSHSRHAIADHKERDRRAYRRKANQILNGGKANQIVLPDELEAEVKAVNKSNWRKSPDEPLGEVVNSKLERRGRIGIKVERSAPLANIKGSLT